MSQSLTQIIVQDPSPKDKNDDLLVFVLPTESRAKEFFTKILEDTHSVWIEVMGGSRDELLIKRMLSFARTSGAAPIGSAAKRVAIQQAAVKPEVSFPTNRGPYKKRRKAANPGRRKRCPECGLLFATRGLGPHMISKHGKYVHGEKTPGWRDKLPAKPKFLNCPVCSQKFHIQGLTRHLLTKHPEEARNNAFATARDNAMNAAVERNSPPTTNLGQAIADASHQKT